MAAIAELFAEAFQQHRAGLLPQAIQLYQQVLQQQPNHAETLNLMGVVACEAGNLREGKDFYQRAVTARPDFAEAHCNLARALEMLGQPIGAMSHYRTALSLKPNDTEVHHKLGNLLVNQGRVEEGMGHFRQALAIKPKDANAHINLGVLFARTGQSDAALNHLQQAIHLQPDLAVAHAHLGHILSGQGRLDEAACCFQQALTLSPTPDLYFILGKTREEQGQTENAIVHFQAALQLKPDYIEAYWQDQLALPILYDTPEQIPLYRRLFCRGLNRLIAQTKLNSATGKQAALQGIGSRTNFYLAYQGLNDRGLQRKYGEFVHRVMAANCPQWVKPLKGPGGRSQGSGEKGRREREGLWWVCW